MGFRLIQGKDLKQKMENTSDRIGDLPDSVLLHIMSFLSMEDVISTSFLSKGWRYLWRSIPNMDFGDPRLRRLRNVKDIARFVDQSIALHDDSKIREFRISFHYKDDYSSRVDSWIDFAVRHNVEELCLDCWKGKFGFSKLRNYDLYKLPSSLFGCESLTSLTLKHCDLNLPSSMSFSSLKTLNLVQIELNGTMVKDLTSNCPLLENLTIVDCNRKSALNIYAANLRLRSLKIIDYYYKCKAGTQIEIYAPNLLSLELRGATLRINYLVQNLLSLVEATIHLEEMLTSKNMNEFMGDYYDSMLKKLLESLRHVKHLKLCSWCIQVLFVREIQRLESPSINVTCLELKLGLSKLELPGIAHLLRGSCNLETLVIIKDSKEDNYAFEGNEAYLGYHERGYWESRELSFSCLLRHLKTVKICNFLGGDRIHPVENGSITVEEFLECHENDIELVKILLKSSRVLERMTIQFPKEEHFKKWAEKSKLLSKLTQKLLFFPKASLNVEIVFS
ncbi:F-box/LRR-repeat protein At3g26922-like [Tasmannia lanceolata]|uniref:F-box/LRR-repeat protein At3g26922-like n=1 Tax=Tasmannia lanceolata TaxID=3420 RepID=UPI00406471C7